MPSAKELVKVSIGGILAFIFIIAGVNKLTTIIDAPIIQFKNWSNLYNVNANTLQVSIGVAEVVFGLLLLSPLRKIASIGVLILSLVTAATMFQLGKNHIPSIVFGALAVLFFLLSDNRVVNEAKEKKTK